MRFIIIGTKNNNFSNIDMLIWRYNEYQLIGEKKSCIKM